METTQANIAPEDEASMLRNRIGDAMHKAEQEGASASLVRTREMVYDRYLSGTKHLGFLRVYERFLTDPAVKQPMEIHPTYMALKATTPLGTSILSVMTLDHVVAAADFQLLMRQRTNDDFRALFGDAKYSDYKPYMEALQQVYIISDDALRTHISENLISTGNMIFNEGLLDPTEIKERIKSEHDRNVIAGADGVPTPLIIGTL